ncbi:DUF2339 domain-containing protein [Wenyingzhuangia sp. chi5]|uniref:DUF2339 domain-containing protein n=1 Tax=Wenyingzhuangia gilva TaxID=3057677 RepID=A0ABT8VP25_9FLAO|nr:DUF2339 domain-containing protein [Wenyingzhuangia sp. chi5]MDO3693712.1 DUF2339 domain-containing protein [Wenyingzhuangia sp. chi5]
MKDIDELYRRLEVLEQKQLSFQKEIQVLKQEIQHFHEPVKQAVPVHQTYTPIQKIKVEKKEKTPVSFNFEKLIGENLINKIGIIITIIGVSIGAKYSIEHDLISPITRILLSYLAGFILLGLGYKLKTKYSNYAAVLTSGAYTILYFITFIAYSFYQLLPMWFAFLTMCSLTILTVFTALKLNKQVIAHIGLVGAYAVPLLLSSNNGNIAALFVYVGIINIGISYIAIKRYWKPLFYNAFGVTWVLFISWFFNDYEYEQHFGIAFGFLSVIYITFYSISLSYKLIKKEPFLAGDVILILSNTLLFFCLGYLVLNSHPSTKNIIGLFTIYIAFLHGLVAILLYKQSVKDKNLQQLVIGFCILFITLTFPIQFEGSWISIFWIGEATILFWIGRTQQKGFYEKLSYPLIVLSFYSLLIYWFKYYDASGTETKINLFLNPYFLSSVLFITCMSYLNFIHLKHKSKLENKSNLHSIFSHVIPSLLIVSTYLAFYFEIATYWEQLYTKSMNQDEMILNRSILKFKVIWLINYSLIFMTILNYINHKKIKNNSLAKVSIIFTFLFTLIYLTFGLLNLSDLRDTYLNDLNPSPNTYFISIRYLSYLFIGLLFYTTYPNRKVISSKIFDCFLHLTILWILSSELINILDLFTTVPSYKLGLSILWAIYSLGLICLGIWKQKQHLRIIAMVLFGVILIKLFLYDISHLGTISKIIVFTLLGIILLLISFLYNKYKNIINTKEN